MSLLQHEPPAQASSERQEDLQARYDRMVSLVMRAGSWLSSPAAQLLSSADWELQFALYRDQLEQLRKLGDELRPVSLRVEFPLTDELTSEVSEMFAEGGAL